MRVDFDGDIPIAGQVQIGVMPLRLSEFRYAIEELHARHEVLHYPVFSDALALVREPPAGQLGQLSPRFDFRVLGHSPFARHALFAYKLVGRLSFHEGAFRWSELPGPQ